LPKTQEIRWNASCDVIARDRSAMTPPLSTVLNTIIFLIAGSPFGPAAVSAVAQKWRGRPVPVESSHPIVRAGSQTLDR
jgi:hypothetical protein